MSVHGMRAARWLGRLAPLRAMAVAAELRNAETPANLSIERLREIIREHDCEHTAILASEILDCLPDIAATVEHVTSIADAMTASKPSFSLEEEADEALRSMVRAQADALCELMDVNCADMNSTVMVQLSGIERNLRAALEKKP